MKKTMVFRTYITITTISLLLASCWGKSHDETSENVGVTIIDLESNISNYRPLKISEMAESLEYIPLETRKDNAIDIIKHLGFSEKYILLKARQRVMLFRMNGSFLSHIGKAGKGPFDYQIPVSLQLFHDRVYVADAIMGKLLTFDTSGSCLTKTVLPRHHLGVSQVQNGWFPLTDSTFLIQVPNKSGEEKYRILILNRYGKITGGYENTTFFELKPTSKKSPPLSSGTIAFDGHFYKYMDTLYYRTRVNDTIWQITSKGLIPKHIINRGKHGIPTHLLGFGTDTPEIKEVVSNKIIFVWLVFETNNYIFIKCRMGKNYPFSFRRSAISGPAGSFEAQHEVLGVYNKRTHEFFFVAPSGVDHQLEPLGIENDIDGGINFAPIYSPNERTLVSWFNAYDLKAHVASEAFRNSTPKYPERKRELEALANRLKDDNNPVLMVLRFDE